MLENRSRVYRAATREAAQNEYHAEAIGLAAQGYVPTSEDWLTALGQQVLHVTRHLDASLGDMFRRH